MLNNIEIYLTPQNIFLISNWGIIPFWLLILFSPSSNITKFLVNTVIIPILFGSAYIYLSYLIFLEGNILNVFNLYYGIDDLYTIFSNEYFLIIFWIHFLSISLFVGSWIGRDSVRHSIPKILIFFSLVITYFSGPVGLVIHGVVRSLFAKKLSFDE